MKIQQQCIACIQGVSTRRKKSVKIKMVMNNKEGKRYRERKVKERHLNGA